MAEIALVVLGIAFAAFCIWLTVRIVNRRERWAKWTLAAGLAVVLVGYSLSYGPWLAVGQKLPVSARVIGTRVYDPIRQFELYGPESFADPLLHYHAMWKNDTVLRTTLKLRAALRSAP